MKRNAYLIYQYTGCTILHISLQYNVLIIVLQLGIHYSSITNSNLIALDNWVVFASSSDSAPHPEPTVFAGRAAESLTG